MQQFEASCSASRSTNSITALCLPPRMRRAVAALVVLVAVAGLAGACAPWPETATGGLAELYPSSSGRINQLEARYTAQAHGPAADRAPAQLLEARGYLIRAKREQAGGLLADAEVSADRVESILRALEGTWPSSARPIRRL